MAHQISEMEAIMNAQDEKAAALGRDMTIAEQRALADQVQYDYENTYPQTPPIPSLEKCTHQLPFRSGSLGEV
eukprot:m.299134 g.299134  ORF g.299134 m.299134 type:complete len:73 (+) comp281038_c0_seq1:170-388(+)